MRKNGVADVIFCAGSNIEAGASNEGEVSDIGGLRRLVVNICKTMVFEAGADFEVDWLVVNPVEGQDTPTIKASASGTASFEPADMEKPGTSNFGVPGGNDAMRVVVPEFGTKMIAQNNFLASEINTISATLMVKVDLAEFTEISMNVFDNAAANESLAITVAGEGDKVTLPRFCVGDKEGFARWDNASFLVRLTLCGGADNFLRSFQPIVVRFNVTNPAASQAAPVISIGSVGAFTIETDSMERPMAPYQGVTLGDHPMKVVVPEFVVNPKPSTLRT